MLLYLNVCVCVCVFQPSEQCDGFVPEDAPDLDTMSGGHNDDITPKESSGPSTFFEGETELVPAALNVSHWVIHYLV